MMSSRCADCGTPVDDEELYCDECIDDHYDTWMCSNCDYQNENEDSTCQGCGKSQ